MSIESLWGVGPDHRRDELGRGDPFEHHLTRRTEAEFSGRLGQLPQERRHQDLARSGLAGQPAGNDDGSSQEVVSIPNGFAGVQTEVDADGLVRVFDADLSNACWMAIAQRRARPALEKATMNPSPCDFTS